MAKEIERQFIVNTEHPEWNRLKTKLSSCNIIQATIHRGEWNKLRVRLVEDSNTGKKSAAFTFKVSKKTKKNEPNVRDEYEWDVPYRIALFVMIGHGEVRKQDMSIVILMEKYGNLMSINEQMNELFLQTLNFLLLMRHLRCQLGFDKKQQRWKRSRIILSQCIHMQTGVKKKKSGMRHSRRGNKRRKNIASWRIWKYK